MPPKKSKNGYWAFVLKTAQEQKKSTAEVQEFCAQKWESMSQSDRTEATQGGNQKNQGYSKNKLTSDGVNVNKLEELEDEKMAQKHTMKSEINSIIMGAIKGNCIDEEVFLIIHMNYLVHVIKADKYYVCEVAVAPFSLHEGVMGPVFHEIVKPGRLPLGYNGPAQLHSNPTHQMLDLVQDEPLENNTEEVFHRLIDFLKPYKKGREPPLLYSDEKTMEMIQKVLEDYTQQFGYKRKLKVYSLEYLLFTLKNSISVNGQVWESDTFSSVAVDRDVFSLTPGLGCDFHEKNDILVHCSKSYVTRYAYLVCDLCCMELSICMKPGFHIPKGSKIDSKTKNQAGDSLDESLSSLKLSEVPNY